MRKSRLDGLEACGAEPDSEFLANFEAACLAQLKGAGLRVTMPRLQVIRALARSNRAMNAQEIHEAIHADQGRIDMVSVYRILQTLLALGIVHRIGLSDGYYACHGVSREAHDSEHLVCSKCGCVTEASVPQGASAALDEQAERLGFRTQEVRIEMLGICGHCDAREEVVRS